MESTSSSKRIQKDIMKLMSSKYDVTMEEGKNNEFTVIFLGPKDSNYEGVNNH